MTIQCATDADTPAILTLHRTAFGDEEGDTVANLVESLLNDTSAEPVRSWVARSDSGLIGHVLFTRVRVDTKPDLRTCILSPLAIAPSHQRRGVGTKLVTHALDELRAQGVAIVLVLGDPGYYARFGFTANHQLKAPYDLPYPDAWQALTLQSDRLATVLGNAICAKSLQDPLLW